ncbi:MAG: glycosyl transferase family 2 [Nanohaloarchaea archaeon QH_8_44_6]|nr:MAG: glycosyl transferase family 2 [Nanohaloarchaea archaeon QH_8_44_6]
MISFVVPALNEEGFIDHCLESIRKQNVEKEIIVTDGGSKDKTLEIADENADYIIEGVRGIGKSRHKGAQQARGNYIAFIDADTVIKRSYSEKMRKFLEEEEFVAASSYFEITGLRSKLIQFLGNNHFEHMDSALLPGFNTFVETETYRKSKGFENISGEDLQFSREIAKHGDTGILNEKLVKNSGRRIKRFGLTGTLLYYSKKEISRRKRNFGKSNHLD